MQAEQPSLSLRERLTAQPPLMWFSLAFLGGIVLGRLVSLPLWGWGLFALYFLLLAILARFLPTFHFPLATFIFILLIAASLGAARYQFSVPRFDAFHIAFYNDRNYDLLITGYLIEPPDYRDTYTNLRIQVTKVDTGDGDLEAAGLLLVRVPANQIFEYGQMVRLRGKVKTPPENEDFSYREYLARQGIHSYMPTAAVTVLPKQAGNPLLRALYAFKERSLTNIYRLFPDPEASLLAGILLGVDTGLTKELQQAFKNTGTAHIIAISGFNISIIAGIFITFFSRFLGERKGAALAVIAIVLYTALVGGDAAVVRAAIMGTLALLARQVGRRQVALNTLLAVALLMCLWNPRYVWDVGFQLSFFATLGLILYAQPFSEFANRIITRYLPSSTGERAAKLFSEFVLLTLAAQLTTLPIMAYHFQRISLVSFIANPFILPAQPAVMILGGLAVLLSHLWFALGQAAAWIALPFVVYTIRIVELFDRVPHGTLYLGDFSVWFAVLFYAALFALTFLFAQGGAVGWSNFKGWIRSLEQKAGAVGVGGGIILLAVALLLTWRAASAIPDGRLHVTFLDAGSADGILIQTPSGRKILINGGESVTKLADQLGRRISSFDRKLDWLVVASTEEEQVAALPRVLERYPPGAVWWSGNRQASFSAGILNEYLSIKGIPVTEAKSGQVLDLGDGATLTALTTGPRGAVLLLEYHNFRAMLPIGMSFDALDELGYGEDLGGVSVLLLADSGYAPSNPEDWIVNLNPALVVLSVAAADPNGLPDSDTLEAVKDYAILRTDQNGWIEISTDGVQMWVNVERTPPLPTETP
ncbi:MAG: ComEC/Rec2 family competence protein [Chloroflexi bacterium]|nr:ComEC/Rec2 family competence protein [Chloroflexota bacterium]MBI5705152.1 ComEC/Rec2 family competence protein [Chloroflexota bacterium]